MGRDVTLLGISEVTVWSDVIRLALDITALSDVFGLRGDITARSLIISDAVCGL